MINDIDEDLVFTLNWKERIIPCSEKLDGVKLNEKEIQAIGEEYVSCNNCGYHKSIIIVNRDKKLSELTQEDWKIDELKMVLIN